MTISEFSFHAFADPDRSLRSVEKLHEVFIASGTVHTVDDFSRALGTSLAKVADPDRGVTNFLRFVEATLSTSSLFNDLLSYPVLMEMVMTILSSSQYFADILVRDPELFRWLTTSETLAQARTKEYSRAEAQRAMRVFQKPERTLDSLRRFFRREVLRIGARDLLGEADLATVTAELSHLADVLIEACCTVARRQLAERFPEPPPVPFAVIGLGKLGGCELNYSSDIDIIVVYEEEGDIPDAGGRMHTLHEYFNLFVEKVVQNLSRSTGEGHLYRVDMRLRPDGNAGPLARSMQSYLLYYESRGELWERQMLLKARVVAGDNAFGARFLSALEPFIFPRTFFHNPKEYIARIKARIEAAVGREENVKLRAGGIRDIEFVVQALQLINGGKNPRIRTPNTLEALRLLTEASLLSLDEGRVLTDAYRFFRMVEHRLQFMLNRQTHELPASLRERAILAKKVGFTSADELERATAEHLEGVRAIFENVLRVESPNVPLDILGVIDGSVRVEDVERILRGYGFRDTRKAAKNVSTLVFGSGLIGKREFDVRVRDAFREVALPLVHDIATTPLPDHTLHNLALVASAQPFPEQLYLQLKEQNFRKLLLTVCATSPRLAKGLARYPLMLETLSADPHALWGSGLDTPLPAESLHRLKAQEELRAGIRYVLAVTNFDALTRELTQLADVVMTSLFEEECRCESGEVLPLSVFALGKYGTRELTFDADLDIVFIATDEREPMNVQSECCARHLLQRCAEVGSEGKLYDVDARLRPEGRNAPLVVHEKTYRRYLAERASLWERQSLTRLRFVTGNPKLAQQVLAGVQTFVYEHPLPVGWVDEIVAMRKKTESRSRVRGAIVLDIKLGAGGMADVEFLAQMIQLRFGGTETRLRGAATCTVLEAGSSLIPTCRGLLERCGASYRVFRKIETLLRLTLEEHGSILPEGEKLETIARVMGYVRGSDLLKETSRRMKEVRKDFLTAAQAIDEWSR